MRCHGLGSSQARAIEWSNKQRVSLTQGPPGTGKTRTALALIDAVRRGDVGARILIASPTNDGLDNLGVLCVDAGMNVGRVGSAASISTQYKGKMAERCYFDTVETQMRKDFVGHGRWKKVRREHLQVLWDETAIMCATNAKACEPPVVSSYFHEWVVLEESCMATEPFTLIPVCQCIREGRTVHLGDPQQLPPGCNSDWAAKNGLNISLMESLYEVPGIECCLLDVQHRMHPLIRFWPGFYFYRNLLFDGHEALKREPIGHIGWPGDSTIVFVNVNGVERRGGGSEASVNNMDEAMALVSFLEAFLSSQYSLKTEDIGIITPYSAQVAEIERLLRRKGVSGIMVGSVAAFQGSEKELILMSTVRCNSNNEIGFLKEERRLNVSISRARRGIVIFGNARTLHFGNVEGAWTSLLERAAEKGFLVQLRSHDIYPKGKDCLRLDLLHRLTMADVIGDGDQAVPKVRTSSAEVMVEKWSGFVTNLGSLLRLDISDSELEDLRESLLERSRTFMQGNVVDLIDILMPLPEHRYNVAQRPIDPLHWDQKAISHQGEIVRAGQPRDIANFFLFNVSDPLCRL